MNFNDTFLNLCFKLGKVLFSILLVISLIISAVLLCDAGIKTYKTSKIVLTYDYDVHKAFYNLYPEFGIAKPKEQNNTNKNSNVKKDSKNTDKAMKLLAEFVEKNKLPNNEVLASFKLPTDDDEVVPYVKGFVKYYDNYITEFTAFVISKTKMSPEKAANIINQNKLNLYLDAIGQYSQEFTNEITSVEVERQKEQTERNIAFSNFLISLSIFILFLFLPILLRIEENTRKMLN